MSEDSNKALFNDAIGKLSTIRQLRNTCHRARIKRNYSLWSDCLFGWREEMIGKMSDEEKEEVKNKEDKIKSAMGEMYTVMKSRRKGIPIKPTENYYDLLDEYGMFLMEIEEKYNFGMPSSATGLDSAMGD